MPRIIEESLIIAGYFVLQTALWQHLILWLYRRDVCLRRQQRIEEEQELKNLQIEIQYWQGYLNAMGN